MHHDQDFALAEKGCNASADISNGGFGYFLEWGRMKTILIKLVHESQYDIFHISDGKMRENKRNPVAL